MESVLGLQNLETAPACCGDPCDGCDHSIVLTVILHLPCL
jgi:hypothetical protein